MGVRRADGVMFEKSGERAVLLDAAGTTLYTLSPVGSLIWHALDGERDANAITQELLERFEGSVELTQLASDVEDFVRELESEGLVLQTDGG